MVGLAALTALAAMAIVGASSASAEATALCHDNAVPCKAELTVDVIKDKEGKVTEEILLGPVKELHMTLTAETVGILHGLEPLFNVLCLNALLLGEVLGLAAAGSGGQQIHLSKLDFTNCGTNSTHTNCTIKALKLPVLVDVLKTGVGVGKATGLDGETLVNCNIPLIGEIDCVYKGEGLSFGVKSAGGTDGHGMLNAENTSVEKTAGSGFCSKFSTITTGLLEPLTDVYISS
jgi:hypothetical protein